LYLSPQRPDRLLREVNMTRRQKLILGGALGAVAVLLGVLALHVDSGAMSGPDPEAQVPTGPGKPAPTVSTTSPTTATTPTTTTPAAPDPRGGPTTTSRSSTTTTSTSTTTTTTRPRQEWSLPRGDLSIQEEEERGVYNALRQGCDKGDLRLDQYWMVFQSPRTDYLFVAAVHVCRGHLDEGRATFAEGATRYGGEFANWAGVSGNVADCLVYQAIRSVLDQIPQDEVVCPGPDVPAGGPPWPYPPGHCVRPTDPSVRLCPDATTTTTTAGTGAA
jgi:hypothetical protein